MSLGAGWAKSAGASVERRRIKPRMDLAEPLAATKDDNRKRTQRSQRHKSFSLNSLRSFAAKIAHAEQTSMDSSTDEHGFCRASIMGGRGGRVEKPQFRSRNPEGIPAQSPGLRGTSYPGTTRARETTPTGLRRCFGCRRSGVDATLSGLGMLRAVHPG